VRLTGKGFSGTARTPKRVSEAPKRAGESRQLSFAVESRYGTSVERRWRVYQHGKGC
jgi:hypothetical protein